MARGAFGEIVNHADDNDFGRVTVREDANAAMVRAAHMTGLRSDARRFDVDEGFVCVARGISSAHIRSGYSFYNLA